MNYIDRTLEIFRSDGSRALFEHAWGHLIRYTRLSPVLQELFGERVHEKIALFPRIGYWPELKNPRTFNEKIAHRKLYTDNNLFAYVADKYSVREYVESKAGKHILNGIYHVTQNPDSIPFEHLPDQFVLKATHGSGYTKLILDSNEVSYDQLRMLCKKWLNETYGLPQREYWYSNITPRILVEEFVESEYREIPLDYKFFVFNGRVRTIQVDQGRFDEHTRNFYDPEWNRQEFTLRYPNGPEVEEPKCLSEMIDIAESLGEDFDFARVDLYNPSNGDIRFGEITLAPGGAKERFKPKEYDFKLGSYWDVSV